MIRDEAILPSAKAFACKTRLEAMKRQGQRTDVNSSPVGPELGMRSNQELSEKMSDSAQNVWYYSN